MELGTEISTPGPSVCPSVRPSASVTSSCVLQQGQMLSPRKRTSWREEKKKNLGKGKAWESFRGFRDRGCDRANRAIPIYAFLFNSPDRTEGAEERERKETREEVENVESRRRNRPVPACTRENGRGEDEEIGIDALPESRR